MGYIYFVVIVFLTLIGYYVWAIFYHNPNKEPIKLDEQKEEIILFDFDEPIKVSKELVLGLRPKEAKISLKQSQEQVSKAEACPSSTRATSIEEAVEPVDEESNSPSSPPSLTVVENSKPFTAELEYLDFDKGIAKRAMRFISAIKCLLPIPRIRFFEVEYNDMYQIDFDKSINEGRTMFAHLPNDSLPAGKD